ncbi:MAG: PAS domain-containing protein, partial [Myxococcales bacterium]|nr:PAS domain-containing protein [Myxococcales bacterium]
LGLPAAAAVGVAVPVLVEDGEPWALALVASTVALRTQERTLVRRMLVGAGLAGALLVALSAYVIRNARRAATMHERLQQADRLAHLTDKAEKILDHIPSGVIALGGDRRVSAVNRWIAERLGRDVLGDDLRGAFPTAPADDVAVLTALLDDALASGEARARGRAELSLFGAPGSYELHAVPLARRVADVHALLVIEDLSDQRRLEDRLLHSEKLATAGQLAAGIAHEIGTPLNVVRGRAELAEARLGPDHPQTPGQRIIIEQIDHVSRMLGQLLDFVRPRPSSMQPVAPGDALAQVVELVSAEADKRKVAVGLDVAADLPSLRADPGHLQQVLVNLTVNALDACDAGGHVTLRARPVDGGAAVVLEVEDDGVGIPAASRAQVFDPFFTTKKRGKGTGLGLWVVAQLVRGHDADIEVRSEAGAGTTFRITWPVAGRAPTSSTGAA